MTRDKVLVYLQANGNTSLKTGLKLAVTANGGDPELTAAEQVPEIVIHWCRFPIPKMLTSSSEP